MLDIKFIRENLDLVKESLKKREFKDIKLVDKALELYESKSKVLIEVEELRNRKNKAAQERNIEEGKRIKEELAKKEEILKKSEEELKEILYKIPNIVAEDIPVGKGEEANKILRKWGEPKKLNFEVKDHLSLGIKLGIVDIEKAGQVTGSRFVYLKGDAVLIQNALYQLVLDVLVSEKILSGISNKVEKGYSSKIFLPVVPPLIINPETYTKMARLSEKDEIERYHLERDGQYLIGSAEHTLGPLHMEETLSQDILPVRYFAFTPCFRREAGSYGKDTRGILRVHQFDKIEMVSFTTSENGQKEQYFIVGIIEFLMQKLKIPYQVVAICTGDMGDPDYRQIDIESWMPSEGKYRETHTSDFNTDYQSRRLNTRVRRKDGKTEFVFMNDATAFAIGRTIIAILENYQQKDGSVVVPEVLRKWVGKDKISSL